MVNNLKTRYQYCRHCGDKFAEKELEKHEKSHTGAIPKQFENVKVKNLYFDLLHSLTGGHLRLKYDWKTK